MVRFTNSAIFHDAFPIWRNPYTTLFSAVLSFYMPRSLVAPLPFTKRITVINGFSVNTVLSCHVVCLLLLTTSSGLVCFELVGVCSFWWQWPRTRAAYKSLVAFSQAPLAPVIRHSWLITYRGQTFVPARTIKGGNLNSNALTRKKYTYHC